jgi:hypothetical protein
MGAVGFGGWLLLQPPWKRWRWYSALKGRLRRKWLGWSGARTFHKAGPNPRQYDLHGGGAGSVGQAAGRPSSKEVYGIGSSISDGPAPSETSQGAVGAARKKRKKRRTDVTLPVIPPRSATKSIPKKR